MGKIADIGALLNRGNGMDKSMKKALLEHTRAVQLAMSRSRRSE